MRQDRLAESGAWHRLFKGVWVWIREMARRSEKMKTEHNSRRDEGYGDRLVVSLILIIVAIGVCIIFRREISDIINGVLGSGSV